MAWTLNGIRQKTANQRHPHIHVLPQYSLWQSVISRGTHQERWVSGAYTQMRFTHPERIKRHHLHENEWNLDHQVKQISQTQKGKCCFLSHVQSRFNTHTQREGRKGLFE